MGPYLTLRERHGRKLAAYHDGVEALKPLLAAYAREHDGRFILFGSAARGTPHDQSDVDILIDFPLPLENAAWTFAEDACVRLDLRPHIHLAQWVTERMLERAYEDGIEFR